MSTRSMVAIKQANGTYLGMWKHWDGDPAFMMSMLNDYGNFCSDEMADELVQFDSCESVLSQEYIDKHPKFVKMEELTPLSNGFYIECGEGNPTLYNSIEECFHEDIDYLYIWVPNRSYRWLVVDASKWLLDEA